MAKKATLLKTLTLIFVLCLAACVFSSCHIHKWKSTVIKESTCTEVGEALNTCECGKKYTIKTSMIDHNYANGICLVCGEKKEGYHFHTWKEATCTNPETCIECGMVAGDSLNHNYINGICITCGKEQYPTHEHIAITDTRVEPTCTQTGLTQGSHCLTCGQILVAQEVISVLGHTEVIDSAVVPTCTSTGLTEGKHCSVCNLITVMQEVLPIIHNYQDGFCNLCGEPSTEYFKFDLLENDTYEIVIADKTNMPYDFILPSSYNGKPISSIGKYAFQGVYITDLTIPASIETIKEGAFYHSEAETITFESGSKLKYIGDGAFTESHALMTIGIPNFVTYIGDGAFYNCSSLSNIKIPSEVAYIGAKCFSGCGSLISVVIPNSVREMGYGVFSASYKLTIYCEVGSKPSDWDNYWNIDDNPTVWGCTQYIDNNYCFAILKDNTAIISAYTGRSDRVVVPKIINGATVIDFGGAFYGNKQLKTVVIPNTITVIRDCAFTSWFEITIYCELEIQPEGWDNNWHDSLHHQVCWYSENPPSISGNYWHYNENGEIAVWENIPIAEITSN